MSRDNKGDPGDARVSLQGADWADDDDAFFKVIRGRMPERDQRIIEVLERVKSVYVDCGRDKALRESFDTFLRQYIATRNGRRDEADVFFVTGESGAGKSAAIARLLQGHPTLQPIPSSFGTVSPYVSIKLKGFTLPRIAGRTIIAASGYPIRADTQRGEIWDVMASRLQTRRTFLVHVDETQHLIKQNASQKEREELANAIKGVSIDRDWPVAFILSGLPSVTKLPLTDEQFERRANFIHFPDVQMPGERKLVVRILNRMSVAAELDVSALVNTDLPERLAHAARYRYARICQVVLAAIHQAISAEHVPGSLTIGHFAKAYAQHSQALGRNLVNPFLADHWAQLRPGSFMIDDEDDEV